MDQLTHTDPPTNDDSRQIQSRDSGVVLLAVAIVSMGWLLSPAFSAGPLALDEHVSYWMLDSEQPSTLWHRTLDVGAVPPLSFVLQQWCVTILGPNEWAMRLPSLLLGWGALPVVYWMGRRVGGGTCGGVAACLMAWHPDTLDEIRIGRCYGEVVFLAALLLLATVWWKEKQAAWQRGALWAACAAAILWSHYTTAPLVAVTGFWLVVQGMRAEQRARVLGAIGIAFGVVAITALPLWPPAMRLHEWSPYLNLMAPRVAIWQTVSPFWWLALPTGGLVVAILGRIFVRQGANLPVTASPFRNEGWLLLWCSLIPLAVLAVVAVDDLSSLANPRYRVAYAPAGAVWVAWLLSRFGTWKVVLPGVLVAIVASWSMQPLRPWQLGRLGALADRDWQAISHTITEKSQPGEPLLVQSGLVESSLVPAFVNDPLFLEYVACRVSRFGVPAAHPRWGLPFFWDEPTQRAFREMASASTSHRLWIAGATDTDLSRSSVDGALHVVEEAGFHVVHQQVFDHAVLIEMSRSAERTSP